MNRFEAYRARHRKPCEDCGESVFKTSKRCKPCDKAWRTRELSEAPLRLSHGGSDCPEYYIWSGIVQRCTNPNASQYADYGGRGIRVCERWMAFDNFIADMGPRPGAKQPSGRAVYSIDRKNNDGDYEPGNCRWATQREQMRKTRRSRILEYGGKRQTLTEWAEVTGIPAKIIHQRIRRGWTVERALGVR